MGNTHKYANRLEELTDLCQTEYGIDPYTIRFLCCCLIPSESPIWGCVETLYCGFWQDFEKGIQHLGLPEIIDMSKLQMRPRYSTPLIARWLEAQDKPRIFVESHGQAPRRFSGVHHAAPMVLGHIVRLRAQMGYARVVKESTRRELHRLLEQVIDPLGRPYTPVPVQVSIRMSDAIKLVGVLNPEYEEFMHMLALNLSILPSASACLEGRMDLEAKDWLLALRVMQGCVREWTWRILSAFIEADGARRLWDLPGVLRYPEKLVKAEVKRLAEAGILKATWVKREWWIERGEGGWWMEVEGLVGGTGRWWE